MKKYILFLTILSTFLFGNMEQDVANLKVGLGNYYIGQVVPKIDSKKTIPTNMAGTIKFKDGDLNVVLRERDKRVIIIYKRFPKTDREKLEITISKLIVQFGNPTAISHSKILYWAFNRATKITENMFNDFKDKSAKQGVNKKLSLVDFLDGKGAEKAEVQLDNIVTVKLNADKDIYSDEKTYNFYYIISANELIKNL